MLSFRDGMQTLPDAIALRLHHAATGCEVASITPREGGFEVAVEALAQGDGGLDVLAVFDKPDPLVGPYFEETIYVTPSRLPRATLWSIGSGS